MSYESLSTIVVLVIVIIIMVGWLPVRTAKGMRKVAEHREDRYSSSLHLVEMDDGTRFSDEHTPQAKGIIMADQTRNAKYTPEHVAHVRQLRRAAIRRRRIVVVSLLTIAVVVLAISFPLHFSPLFALIPAAALATVLALGVHASAQAREWERKVAAERRRQRKAAHDKAMQEARAVGRAANAAQVGAGRSKEPVPEGAQTGEPATDVMEQREIRRALREAQEEQARALAAREARRAARRQEAERQAAEEAAREQARALAEAQQAAAAAQPVRPVDEMRPQTVAEAVSGVEASDETNELSSVRPSRALDAVDMASSPDLISFSLGAPRNGIELKSQTPESLEIKSTKQVAKAVPVEQEDQSQADASADAAVDAAAEPGTQADAAQPEQEPQADAAESRPASDAQTAPLSDTAAFHAAEINRDVDAPEATAESLSVGLDAILSRRSA
ncbi:hypothetical protein JS533_007980 [Bifidobacterium amazonense]|uniref:Membrane associated protein n=1 Tax=Bifidobacterium amazonense TaxID=2809027 RepID=A0ABS9VVU7_9BIFI|nr:hypothetical protein [Bifidobacterium amazonense]MCH9276204.1 hypothetical protein [Bifidobacterium amazonense]